MGRKCFVPDCYTGYANCEEKHGFYMAPEDPFFLERWQEAIARQDRQIVANDTVCAKHFKKEDLITNRIVNGEVEEYKRPKLKPDAVPSIFAEAPESISAKVRRRRKLEAYSKDYQKNLREKWKSIETAGRTNGESTTDPVKTESNLLVENKSEENLFPQTAIIKEEINIKSEKTLTEDDSLNDNYSDEINKPDIETKTETELKTKFVSTKELKTKTKTIKIAKNPTAARNRLKKPQIERNTQMECNQCSFKCQSIKGLNLHTIKVHKSKKHRSYVKKVSSESVPQLKCFKCDHVANKKYNLLKHLYEHTVKEISSKNFQAISEKPSEMSAEDINLVCGHCDFDCSSKTELVAHNMLNHGSFI